MILDKYLNKIRVLFRKLSFCFLNIFEVCCSFHKNTFSSINLQIIIPIARNFKFLNLILKITCAQTILRSRLRGGKTCCQGGFIGVFRWKKRVAPVNTKFVSFSFYYFFRQTPKSSIAKFESFHFMKNDYLVHRWIQIGWKNWDWHTWVMGLAPWL